MDTTSPFPGLSADARATCFRIHSTKILLLQAYCEVESGIPSTEIVLKFNGNSLTDDKKTVEQYGIGEGDMIFLQRGRGANPGMYIVYCVL